ncbi:hypothetical protein ASG39_00020 [Rhizobium sp. Leaf371]|nr:hypothetical protein ASG39_00020 [Rhizobium sp. Leaf371]
MRIDVSVHAVIDGPDAAERAAIASARTSWLQALNSQVDAAFNEAARGGNRFASLLALCGEDGAADLYDRLAPKLSEIGLTLTSTIAEPADPGVTAVQFKRSMIVETDADPLSIDISFSLERNPARDTDYYTSSAPSQVIVEKLHAELRDYLERRYPLQQWRFNSDQIRAETRQFINAKTAQFGRQIVGPIVINSPEERTNRAVSVNGKFRLSLLGRDTEVSYSAGVQLTDAATWERLKRNDAAVRDMAPVASTELQAALTRVAKQSGDQYALDILLNRVDVLEMAEKVRENANKHLLPYGWKLSEVVLDGKPFADAFVVKGGSSVTLDIQDFPLGLNRGFARLGLSVLLKVVDPLALLSSVQSGVQSIDIIRDRMKVAVQDVTRTTTAGEFFDFASQTELKISDALRLRLGEAIEANLSDLGVGFAVVSNSRGMTFRLETNPALERLSLLTNERYELQYGEPVKDSRGTTYPVKFDVRMRVDGLSSIARYKEIFIDHSLKKDLAAHIEAVKKTVEDCCVAVLRRIPANYYYRENLRTTRLDGFLATVLMERIETYHGLVVEIPPGQITVLVDDGNNMSGELEDARRDLKRQVLQNAVLIDAIDDGESERKIAMAEERLGKLLAVQGKLLEGELGAQETFEGLRDNLYPYLQYIADDQNVHAAAKAFLDRQGLLTIAPSRPGQIPASQPPLEISSEDSENQSRSTES